MGKTSLPYFTKDNSGPGDTPRHYVDTDVPGYKNHLVVRRPYETSKRWVVFNVKTWVRSHEMKTLLEAKKLFVTMSLMGVTNET